MSETVAYFDCFSGASGDMILGALLDCGLPLEALVADLALLAPGLIRLRAEKALRGGIRALQVTVETRRRAARSAPQPGDDPRDDPRLAAAGAREGARDRRLHAARRGRSGDP